MATRYNFIKEPRNAWHLGLVFVIPKVSPYFEDRKRLIVEEDENGH